MPSMDVFNSDAFSVFTLTGLVNKVPYVPGRLGELGLFDERGITTTQVAIERRTRTLSLVPVTQRGGPATQNIRDTRDMINLTVPRLAMADAIYADEVQNIREFGSESATKTLQREVASRNARMASNLDATLEHHRLGAIKGQILDADGVTVLYDLNTIFGETAHTEIDFLFGTATTDIRGKCSEVIRTITDELGGLTTRGFHAFVGSEFFDKLRDHDRVRDTYLSQEGPALRERVPYQQFFYGGILFEEYRGAVGVGSWIEGPEDGYVVPLGVSGLFSTVFAPADYWETVNTTGLPRYAKTAPSTDGFDRGRMLEVQTNPLSICSRPRAVVKITTST